MPNVVRPYSEAFSSYLFDESRTMGHAEYVAFARDEKEIREAVRFCRENRVKLTAQGALTG